MRMVLDKVKTDGLVPTLEAVRSKLDQLRSLRTACSVNGEGGAGSLKDIAALINTFGIIGAAAGSLFVFKGKYRAVLINYPNRAEKDALVRDACLSA